MKLTSKDREILQNMGVPEKDYAQIERAMLAKNTIYSVNGSRISRLRAIQILGEKEYLSGIVRSAFHFTSTRIGTDGTQVYFDSSRLFKE